MTIMRTEALSGHGLNVTGVAGQQKPIATNTSQRITGIRARQKGEPMSDLIDRQAAIDALEEWEARYSWDSWCCTHKDEAEKYHIIAPSKVIEDLPPTQ